MLKFFCWVTDINIKLRPRQAAVITSGFSETERVKEYQRLGAGQYVQKPYAFEKIGVAVKKAMINHKTFQKNLEARPFSKS